MAYNTKGLKVHAWRSVPDAAKNAANDCNGKEHSREGKECKKKKKFKGWRLINPDKRDKFIESFIQRVEGEFCGWNALIVVPVAAAMELCGRQVDTYKHRVRPGGGNMRCKEQYLKKWLSGCGRDLGVKYT